MSINNNNKLQNIRKKNLIHLPKLSKKFTESYIVREYKNLIAIVEGELKKNSKLEI